MKDILKFFPKPFLSSMGTLWLFLKISEYFFVSSIYASPLMFFSILLISIFYAGFSLRPWKNLRVKISGSDAYLSLVFGDILEGDGNVVLTMPNTFTTDLDIMAGQTLIGQFLTKKMGGKTNSVDACIEAALRENKSRPAKGKLGKDKAYDIGTVVVFPWSQNQKAFLLATSEVIDNNDGGVDIESTVHDLVRGLDQLWKKVEVEANDEPLKIPAIGAGLSKVFPRRLDAVLFTALDFARKSRIKRPCSELRIFIRPKEITTAEYLSLKQAFEAIAE